MSDLHGHDRPTDGPQKFATYAAAAAVIFVTGWMAIEALDPRPIKVVAEAGVDASAPVASNATANPIIMLDASAATLDLDAGLTLPALTIDASLPTGAPRSVKLGVVLITYAGAEGAPASARPKAQAKEFATGLVATARSDFHQAVSKGDTGSGDDLGRFPRGILDPAVESAVFSLAASDVSEVVETPRGFWIVKRLE